MGVVTTRVHLHPDVCLCGRRIPSVFMPAGERILAQRWACLTAVGVSLCSGGGEASRCDDINRYPWVLAEYTYCVNIASVCSCL